MWITEAEVISVKDKKVGVRRLNSSFKEIVVRSQDRIAYPSISNMTVI